MFPNTAAPCGVMPATRSPSTESEVAPANCGAKVPTSIGWDCDATVSVVVAAPELPAPARALAFTVMVEPGAAVSGTTNEVIASPVATTMPPWLMLTVTGGAPARSVAAAVAVIDVPGCTTGPGGSVTIDTAGAGGTS